MIDVYVAGSRSASTAAPIQPVISTITSAYNYPQPATATHTSTTNQQQQQHSSLATTTMTTSAAAAAASSSNSNKSSSFSSQTSVASTALTTKKSILKKVEGVRLPRDPESEFLLEPEDLMQQTSPRVLSPQSEPEYGYAATASAAAVLVRTRSCSPAGECLALAAAATDSQLLLAAGGGPGADPSKVKRHPTKVYRSLMSTPIVSKKLLKIVRTSSQGIKVIYNTQTMFVCQSDLYLSFPFFIFIFILQKDKNEKP